MKAFEFAKGLSLPVDSATQTFGILARRGAGKSYAAGKLVEGFHSAGVQFVVMDPIGPWYGLRLAADGKSAGIDVPVLGGLRGDIPLNPESGKLIADAVVDTGRSFVLDLSQFSLGDRKRFATAFGEQLWVRQKGLKDPRPIHIVLEEAQLFLPQAIFKGDERMVGIWTEIVRLGRNCGIGVTLISQRPQSVSKEALTQVECLIVLQVNGVPEKKALKEWIVEKAIDKMDLLEELPFLKQGVAYVWSPQWLEHFGKHEVKEKWTYDASATPKVGAPRRKAELKPIDLDSLKEQMAETVKKAEESDPAALKRRIHELEKQLNAKPLPPLFVGPKEIGVLKEGQITRLESATEKAAALVDKYLEAGKKISESVSELMASVAKLGPEPKPLVVGTWTARDLGPMQAVTVYAKEADGRVHVRGKVPHYPPLAPAALGRGQALPHGVEGGVGKGEMKILAAIAQHSDGAPRATISVLTGYKSSSRNTYLQRLQAAGYVTRSGDGFTATSEGIAALGDSYEQLPTGDALLSHWLAKLPVGESRVFSAVVNAYPKSVSRTTIDELTGYKSSSRNTYLQRLSARQLVVSLHGEEVKASDSLFT